jgi:hypothetical protein
MNIEDDLQRALRRKSAPPDLADRVLAQIADERTSGSRRRVPGNAAKAYRVTGQMPWLAAAAAVVLAVSGAARYYTHQQEVAEAERVKQEVRVALQITSEVFSRAQQRILDASQER